MDVELLREVAIVYQTTRQREVFVTKNQPTETIGLPKNDDSIASVEIVKLC
jgi:hypothetical protein